MALMSSESDWNIQPDSPDSTGFHRCLEILTRIGWRESITMIAPSASALSDTISINMLSVSAYSDTIYYNYYNNYYSTIYATTKKMITIQLDSLDSTRLEYISVQ